MDIQEIKAVIRRSLRGKYIAQAWLPRAVTEGVLTTSGIEIRVQFKEPCQDAWLTRQRMADLNKQLGNKLDGMVNLVERKGMTDEATDVLIYDAEWDSLKEKFDHKKYLFPVINELFKGKEFVNRKMISEAYEPYLKVALGEELAYYLLENDERKVYRAIGTVIDKISQGLELKKSGLTDNGARTNQKKAYKYPPGISLDEWKESMSMSWKGKTMRKDAVMRFLEKSDGLIPDSWLAMSVFNEMKTGSDKLICFEGGEGQKWVPCVFDAIEKHKPLAIRFMAGYQWEKEKIISPHFLKQWNGRWWLFGREKGQDGEIHIGLDRNVKSIVEAESEEFQESALDYSTWFDDIVGVTHPYSKDAKELRPIRHLKIEILNPYTWGRLQTKPLHKSQRTIRDSGNGHNPIIQIDVRVNNELMGLLLSYGSNIKVIHDEESAQLLSDMMVKNIRKMAALYEDVELKSKNPNAQK